MAGAIESIRFNPRSRQRAAKIQELADVLPWFRLLSLQGQAIGLDLDALYDRPSLEPRLDRHVLNELRFSLRRALGVTTEDEDTVAIAQDSVSLLSRLDHLVVGFTEAP